MARLARYAGHDCARVGACCLQQMVLSESTHHAAPRGPKKDRIRGEEEDEENYATGQTTSPPTAAAVVYYPMTEAGGELAAGMRPAPLLEPLSQGNIMRHRRGRLRALRSVGAGP